LSQAELDATVQEALGLLHGAGVDPSLVARLGSAQYVVGPLGGRSLGLAFPAYDRVVISANAAGWGWYADAKEPLGAGARATSAFIATAPGGPLAAVAGSAAVGREDLLTTVLHEMGHLAGLPDLDNPSSASGLMADVLAPGVRHTQALDQVFAGLA
jgi:hypothetical protein